MVGDGPGVGVSVTPMTGVFVGVAVLVGVGDRVGVTAISPGVVVGVFVAVLSGAWAGPALLRISGM